MMTLISLAAMLSTPSFAQDRGAVSDASAERSYEVYEDDCADAPQAEALFNTAIFRVDGEFVYSSILEGLGTKIYRIDGEFVYSHSTEGSNDPIYRIDGEFIYSYASNDDSDDGGGKIFRIDGEFVYSYTSN